MWTRKPTPSRRSLRPMAESLETRQLLSSLSTQPTASVSGTDLNGDKWTLTLFGPGTLNVVDKNGVAFTKETANIPDEINTITVSGTVTSESRLVGTVKPGANSDGRVYFQNLTINNTGAFGHLDPNLVERRLENPQNGIAAVDMPNFWLGNTSGTKPTTSSPYHSGFSLAGGIVAPEGINTSRFGGIDTTFTPAGGTPLNQTNQKNEFVVNLGLPIAVGTSIIVDKVITDANSVAASGTTPAQVFQQSATFLVTGRLNLFQANEIDGNANPGLVPTQFLDTTPTSGGLQAGGTYVVSQGGVVTGQIGDIRIGGNATNFTAFAIATDIFSQPVDVSLDPKVSNFFIGGETNNVLLVAPGGSRNVYFGLGMDKTKIGTTFIQNLQANRGALNSAVTSSRPISNMVVGGDVVNTLVQSGYSQTLASDANTPASGFTAGGGVFNGAPLPTIRDRVQNSLGFSIPLAHGGGGLNTRIAGDVINSVFSVSVDPDPSGINNPGQFEVSSGHRFPFGAPNNIVLPRGVINAKVEGKIDNSGIQQGDNMLVSPDIPSNKAFFAKTVKLSKGPVIPPSVPQAPYPGPTVYHSGQRALKDLFKIQHAIKARIRH